MAPVQCDNHPDRPAAILATMFPGGDTAKLCEDCLMGWSAAILARLIGVPPEIMGDTVEQLLTIAAQVEDGDDDTEPETAAETSEGAPTDEPPAAAPADTDDNADAEPEETPPEPAPTTKRTRAKS